MQPQNISTTYFSFYKAITIAIFSLPFLLSSTAGFAQELAVVVKLKVFNGDIAGSSITIVTNDQSIELVIIPKKKRTKLELNFGNTYMVKFEKRGYLTKEVLIDTRNVPLHMRDELLDFGFEIELFKEIEYPEPESDSLKMAQWQYISDYGMFDFERIDECFATKKVSVKKQLETN